jgi:RNA polymerase sigma-70 factor (ECF subfamily)
MNRFERNFEKATGIKFADFYREQEPKLIWFLNKWTRDQSVSEDIASDAFMQCLNNVDKFDKEKSQIHTWLFKIAHNMAIKLWKDNKKLPTVSMDKEVSNDAKLSIFLPYNDSHIDLTKHEINRRKAAIVRDSIYKLPEKQSKYKTVLILREIDAMSYDEIADYLNLNLSTVKSQIKKGREIIVKNTTKQLELLEKTGLEDFYFIDR